MLPPLSTTPTGGEPHDQADHESRRRFSKGVLTGYPKTARSRRRVPLTARALAAIESLPPRVDTPIIFPAPEGGYVSLDNWRTREWYDALDAAGIERRGPTTCGTPSRRRRSPRASRSSS
jgi:integrase